MKSFQEMLVEQLPEIEQYRAIAQRVTDRYLAPQKAVLGVLLTGSVARGDARKGPFGLYVDVTIIVEGPGDIDLEEIFGPSIEPYIPKHCVMVENTEVAFEVVTLKLLNNIRLAPESVIFSKQESRILYDPRHFVADWKDRCFILTEADIRRRSLEQYFRFDYLTCEYRTEKWTHREAWAQLAQIENEALECYCNFLYCINGWFIPRKDWLVYLTYDLPKQMPDHCTLINELYSVEGTANGIDKRNEGLQKVHHWMKDYCLKNGWIT